MAPLRSVRSLSGMTSSASICCSTPSPPHFGQAPNGLLNENSRGSISGMVKPETGQANFSEKMRRSAVSLRCLLAALRVAAPAAAAIGEFGDGHALGELQRLFERIGEARRDIRPHHQAVDHDIDVVGEFLVERRRFGDLVERAVDLHALIAALHEFGELLAVLALAAAHDGREQVDAGAFRQRQDAVDHLRDGLALDRQPGRGRVGHADARPQQPHIVVDLGDGADRRARIARGGLLLDGNGRRQAVDLVDVRLLHHFQELPGIGRQAFDIAALALGVDRVEGERGFAGTGQAGEDHELVARNVEIDVLEIVLAGAADRDHVTPGSAAAGLTTVLAFGFLLGPVEEAVVHAKQAPCSPPFRAGTGTTF